MPRHAKDLHTNMASGEISSLMEARSDVRGWRNGMKRLEDMRGLLQGGQRSRPPLQSLVPIYGTVDGQLLEFEFDRAQGYVVKLEPGVARIKRTDGADCGTLVVPYTAQQVREVSAAQSGDVMVLFHRKHQPLQITRTGATTFSIAPWDFDRAGSPARYLGPFYRYAASSITLQPSATTGTITVTASSAIFTDTSWNGVYVRLAGKQVLLGTRQGDTVMSGCTVIEALANTEATVDWQEQTYGVKRGWPSCACFHDERMVVAGGDQRRQGLYLSRTGEFRNFDVGTGLDSHAIWTGVSGDKVQDIRRVISHNTLLIFTDQMVAYCPQSETKPLTPATIAVRPQSNHGITPLCAPRIFDGAAVYAQAGGKAINEALYNDTIQAYQVTQLSVFASHRMRSPISMAALATSDQIPERYLFAPMEDGTMAVLHAMRDQQVVGWTCWKTPGGAFRSVAVVNNEVFALVQRGATYSLEKFRFDVEACLDGFVVVSPGASWAVSALGPANADGFYDVVSAGKHYGTIAPVGGQVSVDVATIGETYVGIGWTPVLETLPPEVDTPSGTLATQRKRIAKASVKIDGTVTVRVAGLDLLIWDVGTDPNAVDRRKSGTHHFRPFGGWKEDPTLVMSVGVPLPITVLGFAIVVAY